VLHEVVRRGWPELLAHLTLPARVHTEVRRYLGCGQLARGFVHVQCSECLESRLVAFSCKGRGWCPSCAAKRALETSTHLGEVLPRVGYRQWTLTLPRGLRWVVVKQPTLVRAVERGLVRAVWRWQRARAKQLGYRGALKGGAVGFLQLFGGALQLTPHLHVLLPEGLWSEEGEWVVLPPPEDEEVEAVLQRLLRRVRALLAEVEERWPEEDLDVLRAEVAQQRLALDEEAPKKKARRLAVAMGFSLHADTAVHAFDRVGLRKLCGYGARGPVSEERLTRLADGRYRWQPKRGPALTLTAEALVKRLVVLVPPRGLHLTCFHGVFAPNASLRASVMLPAPSPSPAPGATPGATPGAKPKRARLDWATALQRTFGIDVWTCQCGGRRTVRAIVTNRATAEAMLRSMGLAGAPTPQPACQSPPQLSLSM
jgi:hypothetical protein